MTQTQSSPKTPRPDGTALVALDPWLEPYAPQLRARYTYFKTALAKIDAMEGGGGLLGPISQGHHYLGLNRGTWNGQAGVWYREWAPGAKELRLIGDFNGWDRSKNAMARDEFGIWSIFLPDREYADKLTHGSKVKVHVITEKFGQDRIPAYIRRVVQEANNPNFTGQYWNPPAEQSYQWKHPVPALKGGLRIYEAHIGMAQEEGKVGT
ncbi:MAG: 1,4-alpha-glucan-branching enzyme, partial [Phycisphaerae bacterium]